MNFIFDLGAVVFRWEPRALLARGEVNRLVRNDVRERLQRFLDCLFSCPDELQLGRVHGVLHSHRVIDPRRYGFGGTYNWRETTPR